MIVPSVSNKFITLENAKHTELVKAVNELAEEGMDYGLIVEDGSIAYVFGVLEQTEFVIGRLLEATTDIETCAVMIGNDAEFYFIIKQHGVLIDEVKVRIDDEDGVGIKRFTALMSIYEEECARMPLFTNYSHSEAEGGVNINNAIILPFIDENVTEPDWLHTLLAGELHQTSIELKKAIRSTRTMKKRVVAGLSVAATIGLISLYMGGESEPEKLVKAETPVVQKYTQSETDSELTDYYTKQSVQVKPLANQMYRDVMRFDNVQGWNVIEASVLITQDGKAIEQITLHSNGGDVGTLAKVVKQNRFQMNIDDTAATLIREVEKKPLFRNAAQFHKGTWIKFLGQYVRDYWDGVDIDVSTMPQKNQSWNKSLIQIKFDNLVPVDISNMGGGIDGFPFSLAGVKLHRDTVFSNQWRGELDLEFAGVVGG